MTVALIVAGTVTAAALLLAYSLARVAADADHWADLHDLFDDGGEPYNPDDAA